MSGKYFLYIALMLCLTSCQLDQQSGDSDIAQAIKTADSLSVSGKYTAAAKYLSSIRHTIAPNTITMCQYHLANADISRNNVKAMNLYTDSALNFFVRIFKRNKFPHEYRQALLLKGEALFLDKHYIKALNFFNAANNMPDPKHRDDGYLASKIADIYYIQKNFPLAAKYWSESYNLLKICDQDMAPEKFFYRMQGVLNNLGLAFHRSHELDSAHYYYLKNLDYILDKQKVPNAVMPYAKIVAYDNMGGLQLDLGNLEAAEDYLLKSIDIQVPETDGIKIPALIKLTRLYMKMGNDIKAGKAFEQSRSLLDRFSAQNKESEIEWDRLYADFLLSRGKATEAFAYLKTHNRKKDSLNLSSATLYKLDVEVEFELLNQHQRVTDLKHQHKVRMLYFGSISAILVLGFFVVYLILKKSRKNHKEALRENVDLSRLNANYIRIMRVMAHDLRNPLSGITGLAEIIMMDRDNLNEEHSHMLGLIQTTGKHATEMINELLNSGLSDENEPILKEKMNIQQVVNDCVELLRFRAAEKQQLIILKGDQKPKIAEINHQKFMRALNNLIVNAIKFSHNGSNIEIGITEQKEGILISVKDHGVGIPESDREKVFEMFSPAKKQGTNGERPFGLGLSITKKIIEKHSGKIWFESTPDVGTTFFIRIPVTTE